MQNNNVGSSYGGAVYVGSKAAVTVDGAVITGNSAKMGGGIYVSSGTLEVTDKSSINENTVTETTGGKNIYSTVLGTVIIDEQTYTGKIYALEENYSPEITD